MLSRVVTKCSSRPISCAASTRSFSQMKSKSESQGAQRMTASEAFVESLAAQGVTDVFGIVGSAFMDPLDLFPAAGIRFISVQHEQNAGHMADGYARISGKHGVCVAQNGPGITNFVTSTAAAYWAHSPVVVVTPEAATNTKGLGGFQEADQMPIFRTVTKYQTNVANPSRIAELTSYAFDVAMLERGPTQINIPRDVFYNEGTYKIPSPKKISHGAGSNASLNEAVKLIQSAKNPVIIAGGGVVMSGKSAVDSVEKLAEFLGAPVATTYLHNDAFPASHDLAVGPLGYQGFQSAMYAVQNADVVIAIGTRLSPFGTNPQYGIDYWPKDAKIIQVDIDQRRLGLVKEADVYILGDAGGAAQEMFDRLQQDTSKLSCLTSKSDRLARVDQLKQGWEDTLDSWTYDTSYTAQQGRIKPRQALRELEKAMPKNAIVSTDIGNVCSVSNSYLRFEESPSFLAAMTFGNCQYSFPSAMGAKVGDPSRFVAAYVGDGAWGMSFNEMLTCRRENIPVTAVVFRNDQWGAEKKNQVLWFGDRYVGTNLEYSPSHAEVARAMGMEGIQVNHVDEIGDALHVAAENQFNGKATVLELMLTRELGDPFRRDAMKLPQRILPKYQHTSESSESGTGQPVDTD